jgi:hypothetical protein
MHEIDCLWNGGMAFTEDEPVLASASNEPEVEDPLGAVHPLFGYPLQRPYSLSRKAAAIPLKPLKGGIQALHLGRAINFNAP